MNKMTEDNCRIGDPKVMTNTKGAPYCIQGMWFSCYVEPFLFLFFRINSTHGMCARYTLGWNTVHSQKQSAHWAVDVTAQVVPC